jgi:PAS domain S-box-containing protein
MIEARVEAYDQLKQHAATLENEVAHRKRTERKLWGLLESAPDAMVIINQDGEIVLVNAQTERLFGYSRGALLGQPVEMLIPERFRNKHAEHRGDYSAAPHVRPIDAELELYGLRQDGSEFPVDISLSPIKTEEGMLVSSTIRDITERKQAEEALQRAHDQLELRVAERTADLQLANSQLQAEIAVRKRAEETIESTARELERRNLELGRSNKELDDFAYIASHDLKEPLRGLHTYSTFLLEDYGEVLDDDGCAKLETLTRLTMRMGALIDSLLYYSRVGQIDLAIGKTDLRKIVAQVVESLAIPLQDAEVEVHIPTPLPTIRCDKARIGEVFHNLITNAMKYNDKPQKWIEIGVVDDQGQEDRETSHGASKHTAHGLPVFYVRDNGIGIREKHKEAIFGIFKRLHSRDEYGGGTGVGLTIAKKIVERHGGCIWVESSYGEGTIFFFTLGGKEREEVS